MRAHPNLRARRRWLYRQAMAMTLFGVAVVVLISCATPRPKHLIPTRPEHVAFGAAATADSLTTLPAVHERGAIEANPLLRGLFGEQPDAWQLALSNAATFVGFRSFEQGREEALGRPLRWYERVAIWAGPILVRVLVAIHNNDVCRPEC